MPEMIEVEQYRRTAHQVVGSHDPHGPTRPTPGTSRGPRRRPALRSALRGADGHSTPGAIGKLLLLDTDGPTPGSAVRDDGPAARRRARPPSSASSTRRAASTRRGSASPSCSTAAARLELVDPRRLGGVELDPAEDRLGPDALSRHPVDAARRALAASAAPVKAWLLDQSRVAGIGNLLADEILWRAGIDPARPGRSLTPAEVRRLHRHLAATIDELSPSGVAATRATSRWPGSGAPAAPGTGRPCSAARSAAAPPTPAPSPAVAEPGGYPGRSLRRAGRDVTTAADRRRRPFALAVALVVVAAGLRRCASGRRRPGRPLPGDQPPLPQHDPHRARTTSTTRLRAHDLDHDGRDGPQRASPPRCGAGRRARPRPPARRRGR